MTRTISSRPHTALLASAFLAAATTVLLSAPAAAPHFPSLGAQAQRTHPTGHGHDSAQHDMGWQ
ncbi:hypothetical protein E0500_014790 [Streptomyces sp. KM273126]|uniref:hypothetical protein n=1 Tax=Streptomyces sp. KM273126 TaxID=2545247 RepID=UPI00103F66E2|nr:hypothetical protein [Streptomyces sp. KM273126]MBA2808629.1 hypothetical protein [Streptomyces sp. KM273126]